MITDLSMLIDLSLEHVRVSDLRRFAIKMRVDKNGCWIWTATKSNGYGKFWDYEKGYPVGAHIWSYESFVGPVPVGLQLGHTCTNQCVNFTHVRPVTSSQNHQDMYVNKTTCSNGHARNNVNTRMYGNTHICRVCDRERKGASS